MTHISDRIRFDLIDVAVALPLYTTFTYVVPPELLPQVAVGVRVLVPFGRRKVTGYVLRIGVQPPEFQVKPISAVLDELALFPEQMLPFFLWIADYYFHPLGEVIQSALPSGINVAEQMVFGLSDGGRQALSTTPLQSSEQKLFDLLEKEVCSAQQLQQLLGTDFSRSCLSTWENKGWVTRCITLAGGRTRPKKARFITLAPDFKPCEGLSDTRQAILHLLQIHGTLPIADIKRSVPTAANMVRLMDRDGQVVIQEREVYRDPLGMPVAPDHPPALTAEQRHAVETIGAMLGNGYKTFLLAGVTGSGKTEVYLHLSAAALQHGVSVLVLVPEIALVSQIEHAFRARFGECVALLHSGLSQGERYDQWQRIRRKEATIAVGARSAIFAPLNDIGLIIVDEEHDDSYKQEGSLRYNARDMAVVRAQQQGAVAVLGSATPSLQSAYNAQNGKFQKIALHERVDQQVMPEIIVKDLTALREERGIRRYLTSTLIQAMHKTLDRKEQVLLFLNRRGFANTVVCAACGRPLCCQHCDISLTYHQQRNAYQCHYCGFSQAAVSRCRQCGSNRVLRLGLGTEKLVAEIQTLFPAARIARMDRDTTQRKGALVKILRALRDQKIDILVGTQMVAKGHDYPNITLVGIICADLSLSMPDFRAGERTFQLLAQVAGRAGRGRVPGRVILQTYNPLHFSIDAARRQDFEAFYRQEMQYRRVLGYPPVTRMIQIRIQGRDKSHVGDYARQMGAAAQTLLKCNYGDAQLQILGPIEAPLQRIADHYRWQLLVKGGQVNALHRFVHQLIYGEKGFGGSAQIKVSLDVDPVFLM